MSNRASVLSLQLHHTHGEPLTPVREARALVQRGLEGDSHARREPGSRRQVLLLDVSTLNQFGLSPGDLREQITVQGLPDITSLAPGTRLQIGEVTFEATGECAPCAHIGTLLGVEDPEQFRQTLEGRRGLLCRVVAVTGEGILRVGDEVRLFEPNSG